MTRERQIRFPVRISQQELLHLQGLLLEHDRLQVFEALLSLKAVTKTQISQEIGKNPARVWQLVRGKDMSPEYHEIFLRLGFPEFLLPPVRQTVVNAA